MDCGSLVWFRLQRRLSALRFATPRRAAPRRSALRRVAPHLVIAHRLSDHINMSYYHITSHAALPDIASYAMSSPVLDLRICCEAIERPVCLHVNIV